LPARTVPPLLLAGLAIALYQPAFFLGVQANGVAIGTLVAIGSAPLLAALLQAVFDRRAPSRRWSLATGLTLAGLTLVVQPGSSDRLTAAGISASLGAGCAYAVFVLAQQAVAIAFTVAAVVLAPTLIWAAPSWLLSLRGLAVVLHLGIVATFVAYALFARGVSRTPAAMTATLSLAEPLTASVLATLVLAEPFGRTRALGAAVLLGGLALLAFADRARPEPEPPETNVLDRLVVWRKR
jgi:DME family drug/metabolite transporter